MLKCYQSFLICDIYLLLTARFCAAFFFQVFVITANMPFACNLQMWLILCATVLNLTLMCDFMLTLFLY